MRGVLCDTCIRSLLVTVFCDWLRVNVTNTTELRVVTLLFEAYLFVLTVAASRRKEGGFCIKSIVPLLIRDGAWIFASALCESAIYVLPLRNETDSVYRLQRHS